MILSGRFGRGGGEGKKKDKKERKEKEEEMRTILMKRKKRRRANFEEKNLTKYMRIWKSFISNIIIIKCYSSISINFLRIIWIQLNEFAPVLLDNSYFKEISVLQ